MRHFKQILRKPQYLPHFRGSQNGAQHPKRPSLGPLACKSAKRADPRRALLPPNPPPSLPQGGSKELLSRDSAFFPSSAAPVLNWPLGVWSSLPRVPKRDLRRNPPPTQSTTAAGPWTPRQPHDSARQPHDSPDSTKNRPWKRTRKKKGQKCTKNAHSEAQMSPKSLPMAPKWLPLDPPCSNLAPPDLKNVDSV